MLQSLAQTASPVLNYPFIRRTRRNHGLEHATITLLSARVPNLAMSGRSDQDGFTLWGKAETAEIERAAHEALERMRKGESDLAVHPNCGTNLVTQGLLVSGAALAGSVGTKRGAQDYINRLPVVLLMSLAAILFGQPLGMRLQKHFTTSGQPGDLQIESVTRREVQSFGGTVVIHRVATRNG